MIAYAICDSSTLDFSNLQKSIQKLSNISNMIVYRDKNNLNYSTNAIDFVFSAKKYPFDKILLHTDIDLASKLKADGIHLQSNQLDEIVYAKAKGLFVIISTHTLEEALTAEYLGADMITISPIYNSPNKGVAIGIEKLEEVTKSVNIPVIALGGILTEQQIQECQNAGACGFASIRYFYEKIFLHFEHMCDIITEK